MNLNSIVKQIFGYIRIAGATGELADVELLDGKRKLYTQATVIVEQLFGRDPQGTTYFYLGTQYDMASITTGDTVRVQIAAGPNASIFPAVDVTTTATATESGAANKEVAMANLIVSTLNANPTFSSMWKASRMKDFSGVFIASKFFNEWGERKTPGDFAVTTTGSIVVALGFNTVERRGYSTELSRSPNDPRSGTLAISGSVQTTAGGAGDLYIENLKNAGSANMLVNGSVTPVVFSIATNTTDSTFINELRFYGGANGLKFDQFLAKNAPLSNGLLIEVQSDGVMKTFPVIFTTEDFKNKFALGSAADFSLFIQAGGDQFLAALLLPAPIILKKTGSFAIDDYVKVTVRDNLTTVASEFECLAFGFLKEE